MSFSPSDEIWRLSHTDAREGRAVTQHLKAGIPRTGSWLKRPHGSVPEERSISASLKKREPSIARGAVEAHRVEDSVSIEIGHARLGRVVIHEVVLRKSELTGSQSSPDREVVALEIDTVQQIVRSHDVQLSVPIHVCKVWTQIVEVAGAAVDRVGQTKGPIPSASENAQVAFTAPIGIRGRPRADHE